MTKKRDSHHPLEGFAGPISSPGTSGLKTGALRVTISGRARKGRKVVWSVKESREDIRRRMVLHEEFAGGRARREEPSGGQPKRVFGAYKGKFSIGAEFFEPLTPEELKAWGDD